MKNAGFVVFKNLLNTEEVEELRRLMDETGGDDEDHYKPGHYGKTENDPDYKHYDKHIGNTYCMNDAFLKYVSRQPAIDVIETIHGYGTHPLICGPVRRGETITQTEVAGYRTAHASRRIFVTRCNF